MDITDTSIACAVSIDWHNQHGVSVRKIIHKLATLRLVRNDLREMFVEVSTEKSKPIKFKLAGIKVHKNFMAEGKASIKFITDQCLMMISNAPSGTLMTFMKTLFVKMTGEAGHVDGAAKQKMIRAHMLSGVASKFEDISPVTNVDLSRAQRFAGVVSKRTVTTPSPLAKKRKLADDDDDAKRPVAKKLYADGGEKARGSLSVRMELVLNEEQTQVYQACLGGKSVFFTGSAGTGKSFLLKKIISSLPPDGTIATASTGVAACLIGGVTLHSFAGIGSGEGSLKRCYDLAGRTAAAQIWRRCKILIIDEISMVDGEFFDKIEAVARFVRRNDKPFGGIQLILCGDFLQLPPIRKTFENKQPFRLPTNTPVPQSKQFCFQSDAWRNCVEITYELKIVHRQKDAAFVRILNLLRIGHVNEEITNRLLATSSQKIETNGILATQLCSHTNDANVINETKLQRLPGESRLFDAQDSDASAAKQLDGQVPAPGKLELKIGAQVMLLKNINVSDGLVNGARGIIMRFENNLPVVKFKNNREYVAKPEKWTLKSLLGNPLVRRQVPLKLAWAFSIHKSQGLTLDCVEMSLSKVFEAGQAYVALSRVQSLECLRVLDFDGKQVWANPDVLQFYKMFRRNLHDQTFIPLGIKSKKASKTTTAGGTISQKLSKGLMNKPLISIC